MISGVGSGEAFGTGTQPVVRNPTESLRTNTARASANAAPSEEPLSRPRPPGPTEADGPQVWGNGYLSPVYRFDGSTSTLFFEQRAFVSGDTTRQVPLESAVKLYRLFEQVRQGPLPARSGAAGEQGAAGQGDDATPAAPVPPARLPATDGPAPTAGIGQSGDGVAGDTESPRPSSAAVGQVLDIVA